MRSILILVLLSGAALAATPPLTPSRVPTGNIQLDQAVALCDANRAWVSPAQFGKSVPYAPAWQTGYSACTQIMALWGQVNAGSALTTAQQATVAAFLATP